MLVEQSIEFDQNMKQSTNRNQSRRFGKDISLHSSDNHTDDLGFSSSDIQKCVDFFHDMSEKADGDDGPFNHQVRTKILDELELSYVYATEMKRASLSAWTWLRSVGRSSSDSNSNHDSRKHHSHFWIGSKSTGVKQSEQFTDKDNIIKRLNQELSNCRAEIGRLKALNRNEVSGIMFLWALLNIIVANA